MLALPFQGCTLRQFCPPRRVAWSFVRCLTDDGPSQRTQPLKPPPSPPSSSTTPKLADAESPSPPPHPDESIPFQGIRLPTEDYIVKRTPTRNLPVYQYSKHGGNLKMTRVRKLSGRAETLRAQLEAVLTPTPRYIKINTLTGHIFMKGYYKDQIERYLTEKGF